MQYDQILEIFMGLATSYEFYMQSIALTVAIFISYISCKIAKRIIIPKISTITLKKDLDLNLMVTKYILPLLFPLFVVIYLSIALSVCAQFSQDIFIIATTVKLATLFLFIRFLRVSSGSNFISNVAGIFLIPALVLDVFGILQPTIKYLDQYAIQLGEVRISVYLLMKAFMFLVIIFWIAGLISKKAKSYINDSKDMKASTKTIMRKIVDISFYAIIAIGILKSFGVDMTTFAVLGGAVGVGIGFGLQKIASNFISGIILLFEKTVEIGDLVELENGAIFGNIKHFGGRYTLIESFDGKEIMVPNEEFIIGRVTNWTYSSNRARIEVEIGVAYGTDLELVKEILIKCAKEHPRCLNYPNVDCFLEGFGDFDIKFKLMFWVSDVIEGRLGPKSDVLLAIWKEFQQHNIEIPFPQREVKILND